jgi:hypothetical protein
MVSRLHGMQCDMHVDDVVMARLTTEHPDGSGRLLIEGGHLNLVAG